MNMRAIGGKAVDLRRANTDYALAEEEVVCRKTRNGILAGGIVLAFVASLFSSFCNIAAGNRKF